MLKEVEQFILKHAHKMDKGMLDDITIMWSKIGGDPELPRTDQEIYEEVCSRG